MRLNDSLDSEAGLKPPSFVLSLADDLQSAACAIAGEILEFHARITVTKRVSGRRAFGASGRTEGMRAMIAIRSFYCGWMGFSYTSDFSAIGLDRALFEARSSRTFSLDPPPAPPSFGPFNSRKNRSLPHGPLVEAWEKRGLDADFLLQQTQTTIVHIHSGAVPLEFIEGSSSLAVSSGSRAETVWGRELGVADLDKAYNRVESTSVVARPWSLVKRPVVFVDSAGAALTTIVLQALINAPLPLSTSVAKHLPDSIRFVDDGSDPAGPAGGPFDGEGWPTTPRVLAENGALGIDPAVWGRPSKLSGPRGLVWRPDLAQPPVLTPSNVSLRKIATQMGSTEDLVRWVRNIDRGFICDMVVVGALSFDQGSGTFAVPCEGFLVRGGEITDHRVRGILQGSVTDLVAAIADLYSVPAYVPMMYGVQVANLLVDSGGITLRSG